MLLDNGDLLVAGGYDANDDPVAQSETYTPFTLEADSASLSAASGGTVNFHLVAGSANALRNYIVLGGVTGTVPGTSLPGGFATLPLNWDAFTDLVMLLLTS